MAIALVCWLLLPASDPIAIAKSCCSTPPAKAQVAPVEPLFSGGPGVPEVSVNQHYRDKPSTLVPNDDPYAPVAHRTRFTLFALSFELF